MAFLPGIFSRPAVPAAAAPAPQGGPASRQPEPVNGQQANPANMPGSQAAPAAGGPEPAVANPMDVFTNLLTPRAPDPKAPKTPTLSDPLLAPLDPVAFNEQLGKANFTQGVDPANMTKALQGDIGAFKEILDQVGRQAFGAAAKLSHGLAENGAREAGGRVEASLDSRFRDYQVRAQNPTNEALSHPAVAPMLQGVKLIIAQNNPQLSATEVNSRAEEYFTNMAQVLANPKDANNATNNTAGKKGDFSYLLN